MYLSTLQAAQLLGVSRQYFHRTAIARQLPYARVGRTIAWYERDVREWAKQRQARKEPPQCQ